MEKNIDLYVSPELVAPTQKPPPGKKFITRRWVIYSVIIVCLSVVILLIILSGILFSQNQNIANLAPSNPPVSWRAKSPFSNVPPGWLLMSSDYFYTFAFTGNLFLFATTTLGGRPLWSTENSNSSKALVFDPTYASTYVESKLYLEKEEKNILKEKKKEVANLRTLNFTSTGVLFIRDESTSTIIWRSSPNENSSGTYYLQVLNTGVVQIVTQQGIIIWSIDVSTISGTSTTFNVSGNRAIQSGSTLRNGAYTLTFDGTLGLFNIYQINVNPPKRIWISSETAPTASSFFSSSFTSYGNLLIFNQNRDTVWSSHTASLIAPPFSDSNASSNYNLVLSPNGVMELNYKGTQFFQTSVNGNSQIFRQSQFPYSQSSPFFILRKDEPQIIIQSSDALSRFMFEIDGSLSLYSRNSTELNFVLISQTKQRGEILYLHGIDTENSNLIGMLALYNADSMNPIWVFSPSILVTNPSTQLPITLCFDSNNRLSLINQNQEILLSQNVL